MKRAITEAINAADFQRSIAVQRATRSLDIVALDILAATIGNKNMVTHPPQKPIGMLVANMPAVNAIGRLLDLGILRTKYPKDEFLDDIHWEEIINQGSWLYELTEFGIAVRSTLLHI